MSSENITLVIIVQQLLILLIDFSTYLLFDVWTLVWLNGNTFEALYDHIHIILNEFTDASTRQIGRCG